MKTIHPSICICLLLLTVSSCNRDKDPLVYLDKVLNKLEKIEFASYHEVKEAWNPGDTVPMYVVDRLIREYNNPNDTTIGASYVEFDMADPGRLQYAYDGTVRVLTYHEDSVLMIDNFLTNVLPFRLVGPPFFNYTKNIIRYILNTEDNIQIESEDRSDHYYFKLTVDEEKQVEFFGKAYYIDNPYYDSLSIYELWINKSTKLPYKVRREMGHSISVSTCLKPEIKTSAAIEKLDITDYFPENYETRDYGSRNQAPPQTSELEGKPAPFWTLNDTNEQPVSLTDIKSKVVLINFTGIGCGPCRAAIPFLRKLKESFTPEEFELVSIETWNRQPGPIQNYGNKNNINYQLLCGTDEVIKDYQSRGVPTFFILDNQRTIRKVFTGYGKNTTDEEIMKMIRELL